MKTIDGKARTIREILSQDLLFLASSNRFNRKEIMGKSVKYDKDAQHQVNRKKSDNALRQQRKQKRSYSESSER